MLQCELVIVNKLGLHARAAAQLVKTAQGFSSDINLVYKQRTADAKSIMELMMLAAAHGAQLCLEIDGEDAEQAMASVTALFAQRFGENE